MLSGNGAALLFGGLDPCGESELVEGSGDAVGGGADQVDGGGLEELSFESGLAEAVPEVGLDLIGR